MSDRFAGSRLAEELRRWKVRRQIFLNEPVGPVSDVLIEADTFLRSTLWRLSNSELASHIADMEMLLKVLRLSNSGKDVGLAARALSSCALNCSGLNLKRVVNEGLGGDADGRHKWILDYDIVAQRYDVIHNIVLPTLRKQGSATDLAVALKEAELAYLRAGQAISWPKIHSLIRGDQTPLRRNERARSQSATLGVLFPNPGWRVLIHLARTRSDLVRELAQRFPLDVFTSSLGRLAHEAPTCLVVSRLGYPMGGGESYMHQTCRALTEFGINCVWLSFVDALRGNHEQSHRVQTPYYLDIGLPDGMQQDSIERLVEELKPHVIHAHSEAVPLVEDVAAKYRTTSLLGYHFWPGLVDLGETSNRKILQNIDRHKVAANGPKRASQQIVTRYVASEFMKEVYERVGGREPLAVIHPISDPAQFAVSDKRCARYVLCLNMSPHKGGEIVLDCIDALANKIDFMAVETEVDHGPFAERLRSILANYPNSVLCGYSNVQDLYKQARLVLVPTLVDETFCRVAYEAAMNGIPVLSTRNGFLPTLLGSAGQYLSEDSADWIAAIKKLASDGDASEALGRAQQAYVRKHFATQTDFIDCTLRLIDTSARHNIGIFTVWGDQGLGNLLRHYTRLLRESGKRVHVFSFQSYATAGASLTKQANPAEWAPPHHADSIHYSYNDRENVTVHELQQFVLVNRIQTLIVPEICWTVNWQRILDLAVPGLSIVAVPMPEIVLDRELQLHNRCARTLFTTRLCERVLEDAGIRNGRYIGHGLGDPIPSKMLEQRLARVRSRGSIRYLHVAGHNPTTRKNTVKVLDAFIIALQSRSDISLTVTTMVDLKTFYNRRLPKSITIIYGNLPHSEINALYNSHDVSIQVSSHEGLGLGFYESIAHAVPVISLDASPHNEVVVDGKSGWLIPASPISLPDNDSGLVPAWRFDTDALSTLIVKLQPSEIARVTSRTASLHSSEFDDLQLKLRLLQAL